MHHLIWAHGCSTLSKLQLDEDDVISMDRTLCLTYRHLHIRCREIAKNLVIRHKAMLAACNFLNSKGVLEVTTLVLATSTPRGIREHLLMHLRNYLENLNFMLNKHPKGDK